MHKFGGGKYRFVPALPIVVAPIASTPLSRNGLEEIMVTLPNDALSPVSDFPSVFEKNFRLRGKISDFTFSYKLFSFHPPKFPMTFFCHWLQILNLPTYFRCFTTFSPYKYFGKIIISPYLCKFPSDFAKPTCFLHTLCVFRFPLLWPWCIYASHNARTRSPFT